MLILLLWALACAYQDIRHRHISNRLTYPYLMLSIIWLLINAQSVAGFTPKQALLGAGVALALTIPGHIKGVLGGGDVKMMAAIGISTSSLFVLLIIAITALLLIIWTAIAALMPANARNTLQRYAPGLINQQGHFAYGPFIFLALGTLQAFALLYRG